MRRPAGIGYNILNVSDGAKKKSFSIFSQQCDCIMMMSLQFCSGVFI